MLRHLVEAVLLPPLNCLLLAGVGVAAAPALHEAARAHRSRRRAGERGSPQRGPWLPITVASATLRPDGAFAVDELMERITVDPEQCGGRPCVRGMRIRVVDVLDLLANGLTFEQVIEELPDLEMEDIKACLRFASRRLDHPVIVA